MVKYQPSKAKEYLAAVILEISLWRKAKPDLFQNLDSLYIGGGTPSIYKTEDFVQLLAAVGPLPTGITSSIELNPENVTRAGLRQLMALGFTRFSFGLQTFSNEHLALIGRSHTTMDNDHTLEAIAGANLRDFNLDLIYGYPGYTIANLEKDLSIFISAKPDHLSAYNLSLEPNTLLYTQKTWREYPVTADLEIVTQFHSIFKNLAKAGLQCYEVSNFSRKGHESVQNNIYWQRKNFLGMGLGAFSGIGPWRFHNEKKYYAYMEKLNQGELPVVSWEKTTAQQRLDEYFIIQLRRPQGIAAYELGIILPDMDWEEFLKNNITKKPILEKYFRIQAGRYMVTTKGMLMADALALQLSSLLEKLVQSNRAVLV